MLVYQRVYHSYMGTVSFNGTRLTDGPFFGQKTHGLGHQVQDELDAEDGARNLGRRFPRKMEV